ncbi:MAG: PqqD family peptide modification chaperone [Alistipes sp.]|nr:PqqD family peptide modification chaperone [Alistipes sp.]
MKFKKEYKVRDIAGEHVVIMQGKLGSDVTRVVALNETSLFLWGKLQGEEFDVATVKNLLLENYEVAEEIAAADAENWVRKLDECGLLTE